MTGPVGNDNLSRRQQRRLRRFGIEQCVDIHCHCLPGLDDGPATTAEALALCRALVADGITTVIATPHQLGRYDRRNSCEDIRRAVSAFNASLLVEDLPIRVVPGADVRIDERLAELLTRREVMTLADGGRYVLLELPHEAYIDPMGFLEEMAPTGIQLILTHPERCRFLSANPALALPWLETGLLLQITAGSLLGDFGALAEKAAWHWLAGGHVCVVATDAHDTDSRRPCMSQAIAVIASRLGADTARRICLENPLHVLEGSGISCTLQGSTREKRP